MSDISSFLEDEGEGAVKDGVRQPTRTHVSVLHMSLPLIVIKHFVSTLFLYVSQNKHGHSQRNTVHRVHSHRSVALVSLCHA